MNILAQGFHNFHNDQVNEHIWDESIEARGLFSANDRDFKVVEMGNRNTAYNNSFTFECVRQISLLVLISTAKAIG